MASFPSALWYISDKYGYGSTLTHKPFRVIVHSAEGYHAGLFSVLDGPREASWHFSVMKNAEVWQHMSTVRIAWHAGSFAANNGSIGIECEGKRGEPLTNAQYQALVNLLKWMFETHGLGTPSRATTLREHNEFRNTSCPDERIPWARIIEDMKEDDMTQDEFNQMFMEAAKTVTIPRNDGMGNFADWTTVARVAGLVHERKDGGVSIETILSEIRRRLA